jgi:ligand-binding sensor domain-containing protein
MRRPFDIAIVLLSVLTAIPVIAQEIRLSNWQTISSLYTVKSMDVDAQGTCWAATSGGVVRYVPSTGSVTEYRNVGALQSLDCSAIYCDRSANEVYVGQVSGAIDVLRSDGTWYNIRDIRRATQYPRRSILAFAQRGDTLIITTEFGFVLWDSRKENFIATIDRIGTVEENSPVRSVALHNDSIWVATSKGLAVAPLNVQTLRLPSVWSLLTKENGLDDNNVLFCKSGGSELAVATARGLYTWRDGGFRKLLETTEDINGIAYVSTFVGGSWEVSTASSIISETTSRRMRSSGAVRGFAGLGITDRPIRLVAVEGQGFGLVSDDDNVILAPIECPSSNQFADLSIDTRGNLWVATDDNPGRGFGGQGVSWFDGLTWRTISTANQPLLASNNCYSVSSLPDGSTWVGTWGRGALRCTPSDTGLNVEAYTFTNSSLRGVSGDSTYVLVSGAKIDRYGRTWLLNEQAANQLLSVRSSSGWGARANCTNSRENVVRHMAIDLNGTVWLGGHQGLGLIAYNDRNTADPDDDLCNKLTVSNTQLPDNAISALATDLNGALWVGTSKGLAVITSTGSVSNSSVPFVRRVSALSSATVVTDITVDALNYKWIATTSGVFVLDPSGTEVLATITASTSPLLDDNVRSIAVDDFTGLVYFGTNGGCSVARSSSIRPLASFDLSCYPQPFSPTTDRTFVIDGLAPDSDIKIMSISGTMVTALQVRGRQAIWDGTDASGTTVAPGIYLVSASSASAGTAAVAKFAVTR